MKLIWSVVLLAALGSPANAAPALENLAGEELLPQCRKAEPEFCRGYIQSVSKEVFTRGTTICVDPEATSQEDLIDNVVQWVANYSGNPDELRIYRVIETLYPCDE